MGVYTYTVTVEISIMASLKDGTLPQHAAIPLLGIYPKDSISYHNDTCSNMFITVFSITARKEKQSRCSFNRRMDKEIVAHLHNGALLSC